jgi:hypothetical protein
MFDFSKFFPYRAVLAVDSCFFVINLIRALTSFKIMITLYYLSVSIYLFLFQNFQVKDQISHALKYLFFVQIHTKNQFLNISIL